jgi:hypothetical protein
LGQETEQVLQNKSDKNMVFKYDGKAEQIASVNKPLTAPATTLAQKYNGMKYSIAPLKQTNETILVFQKPYKTGSCLHDTLGIRKRRRYLYVWSG